MIRHENTAIEPVSFPDYAMSGPEEGDKIDTSVWVTTNDGDEIISIVETGDNEADKELGRTVADGLNNIPLLNAYQKLHNGLSDMIEGGRLTEADIPDDYRWLVESLETIGNAPQNNR